MYDQGVSHYQVINEPIAVVGSYDQGRFTPYKFRWGRRVLPIETITLQAETRDGGVKKRLLSILSGNDLYRLEFNRESEEWYLREIWVE